MFVPRENDPGTGLIWLTILISVTAMPRIYMALGYAANGGDWHASYLPVALNILYNSCVSLSDPNTAACIPSWGGNHLPGYPLFIAAVWTVFPESSKALLIAQTVVYAISVFYFSRVLRLIFASKAVPYLASVGLMISPQLLPWSRFAVTDTLSVAVTIWVFAELARSLVEGKLRIVPVSVALAVATFLRFDSIVLCAPVALIGFWLHDVPTAIKKGLIIALITGTPLAAWTVRSVSLGLPLVPELAWQTYGSRGYLAWAFSWSTNQYEHPKLSYPIESARYSYIEIDSNIYVSEEEQRRVEGLLKELRLYEGQRMPKHIDEAFAELASIRRNDYLVLTWLVLPAVRIKNLWFNPYNSHGWPVSVGLGAKYDASETSRWRRALEVAKNEPLVLLVKAGNAIWRISVLLLVSFLLFRLRRFPAEGKQRALIYSIVLFAVTRTMIIAELGLAEARYMLPAVAMLEVALIILCSWFLIARQGCKPDKS
jgi:hypothetical protein